MIEEKRTEVFTGYGTRINIYSSQQPWVISMSVSQYGETMDTIINEEQRLALLAMLTTKEEWEALHNK